MTRFTYDEGYLFCSLCNQHFKIEECPIYKSKVQTYRVCPLCPQKYKLRKRAHNPNWKKYHETTYKTIKEIGSVYK